MSGARKNPLREILGEAAQFEDLKLGQRLQPTDGVIVKSTSAQMIIRPSGTEPKLKCYLHFRGATSKQAQKGIENLKRFASDYLDTLR